MRSICIRDYYYNLTKPYFLFSKGEIYHIDHIDFHDSRVYSGIWYFKYCDWIISSDTFERYFITLDEYRDKKINRILGDE